MRTLCALVILVAVSGPAAGETSSYQSNSRLTVEQLVEICDPDAAGASQLYCNYYMMGLADGLSIAAGGQAQVAHCVPERASSQKVRRAVYERIVDGSRSRKPAVIGVAAALNSAFPCQ